MTKPKPNEQPTFEDALREAEEIVRALEDGSLNLHTSLKQYERGIQLLGQCFELLERAELRIHQLGGFDEEGRPRLEAFQASAAMDLDEKARTRSQRRSAQRPEPDADPAATGEPDAEPSSGRRRSNRTRQASVDEDKGLF